jgi:hypothetical protein
MFTLKVVADLNEPFTFCGLIREATISEKGSGRAVFDDPETDAVFFIAPEVPVDPSLCFIRLGMRGIPPLGLIVGKHFDHIAEVV